MDVTQIRNRCRRAQESTIHRPQCARLTHKPAHNQFTRALRQKWFFDINQVNQRERYRNKLQQSNARYLGPDPTIQSRPTSDLVRNADIGAGPKSGTGAEGTSFPEIKGPAPATSGARYSWILFRPDQWPAHACGIYRNSERSDRFRC